MSSSVKRKSAAVMFTDIAGYTNLMATDEEKALSLLHSKRDIIKPLIEKYDGVYVKGTGDGTLSYFESAYKASKCAKTFQESIYDNNDMNVRVGIHIGDIVFEEEDVYGDGVNVASRLESMAPVGGICVSNTVYDELRNKKEFDGIGLGLQSLKGVGRLVEVFGLKGQKLAEPNPQDYKENVSLISNKGSTNEVKIHNDDKVPSVAILSFKNKGKEEDEFYSHGIWLDLITQVSGAGLIRVSSKQQIDEIRDLPINEIANNLCVRYIVTGELWKLGDKFQLFIELYDTKESKILWTDTWQENWENLITIKGKISEGLLKALDVKSDNEKQIKEINPDAYKLYLKAHYIYEQGKSNASIKSIKLCKEALLMDDNLIEVEFLLGVIYFNMGEHQKWQEIYDRVVLKIDNNSSIYAKFLMMKAHFYTGKRKFDQALEYSRNAQNIFIKIDHKEGLLRSIAHQGWVYANCGKFDKGLTNFNEALKICEKLEDPMGMILTLLDIAFIETFKNWRINKTEDLYNQAYKIAKSSGFAYGIAMCYMGIGNVSSAKGDFKKAEDYLNRSITLFKNIGNKVHMSLAKQCLAENYYFEGRYKEAQSLFDETFEITEKIDYRLFRWSLVSVAAATRKKLGLDIDYHSVKKEMEVTFKWLNPQFLDYYFIYIIFEDKEDIKKAYDDIHNRILNSLDADEKARFLNSIWCKQTIEEWEKINN